MDDPRLDIEGRDVRRRAHMMEEALRRKGRWRRTENVAVTISGEELAEGTWMGSVMGPMWTTNFSASR